MHEPPLNPESHCHVGSHPRTEASAVPAARSLPSSLPRKAIAACFRGGYTSGFRALSVSRCTGIVLSSAVASFESLR